MKFIVRMRGGLGNQMFQYAYTLALRERYPEAEIVLDTREYGTYTRRSFALTDFVLAKNTSLFSQGRLAYDVPIRLYHVWQRLYREVRHEHPFGVNDSLARRGFLLTGLGCPLPRGGLPETTFLYGYFQNADVLLPIRDTLRKAFSLPDSEFTRLSPALLDTGDDAAAVSIRLGGDILQSGWHLCSKEYYRAGIEEIRRTDAVKKLLVFSDAPERVIGEKWFDDMGAEIVYASGLSPASQMELLKRCRRFVISNSTFAWWGAFLGAGTEGDIVAPRIWQGNRPTEKDPLYLKNMILL